MKSPAEKDDLLPEVLMFIGRFSHGPKHPRMDVIECFRCGCCYWFAYILSVRFEEYHPEIMIDYVANHFGCKIGSEVYDIGGIVTNDFHWEPFRDCIDTALEQRIIEQCIMF